jgi:hypothetical protein
MHAAERGDELEAGTGSEVQRIDHHRLHAARLQIPGIGGAHDRPGRVGEERRQRQNAVGRDDRLHGSPLPFAPVRRPHLLWASRVGLGAAGWKPAAPG